VSFLQGRLVLFEAATGLFGLGSEEVQNAALSIDDGDIEALVSSVKRFWGREACLPVTGML